MGVGGVIKKRKGGMAWTIPKDDEELVDVDENDRWGAPAPAPAPAAAPGEAPVPAHKGGWKNLAKKTKGWWGKHAHASAPASDGKKHGAGWWGKHAKAPAKAPAKARKGRRSKGHGKRRSRCPRCHCHRRRPFRWGRVKGSSRKLYGKRRGSGSGSGSGKKKFSWGSIKTKGKSWFKKVPHKKGSWGKLKTKGKKLYGKRRGSGSGKKKKKFSWGSIKAKGKSWLNKAKTKGKSWLHKAKKGGAVACPKVGKLPAASAKTTCAKAGCNYSEDKSNPFKTVRTCSRGSGSGSGSGFNKRKGGIAWTIPSSSGSGSGGSGVGGVIKKRKGGMAWTIPKDDEEEELEDDVEEQQWSKCSNWGTHGCHFRVYSGCKGCAWQRG